MRGMQGEAGWDTRYSGIRMETESLSKACETLRYPSQPHPSPGGCREGSTSQVGVEGWRGTRCPDYPPVFSSPGVASTFQSLF